jgi:hypothetical protein
MTEQLIMLIGAAGSGKTTSAYAICKYFNFSHRSFAAPIKAIASSIGFTDYQLLIDKNQINDKYKISAREFLQKFGTEICRTSLSSILPTIGDNFWLNIMEQEIMKNDRIVICDGRFQNEADLINKYKGIIIKIERPNHISITGSNEQKHSSETEYNKIVPHYTIINDSDEDILTKKILDIVSNKIYNKDFTKNKQNTNCYIPKDISLNYKFIIGTIYILSAFIFYKLYMSTFD